MKSPVILPITFFLFMCFQNSAQEKEKNVELKFYYNCSRLVFEDEFAYTLGDYHYIRPSIESNTVGEFSVGLIFNNNNSAYSHEFEIMPFSMHNSTFYYDRFGSDDSSWDYTKEKQTAINSRLRYQLNYLFMPTKKVDFYIGLSSMLSYYHQKTGGGSSLNFTEKYNQLGLILGVSPGFKIPISEKLNFTFDVPVGILGVNYRQMNLPIDILPTNEQKQSSFSIEKWYQGFQVRAGIGFNL